MAYYDQWIKILMAIYLLSSLAQNLFDLQLKQKERPLSLNFARKAREPPMKIQLINLQEIRLISVKFLVISIFQNIALLMSRKKQSSPCLSIELILSVKQTPFPVINFGVNCLLNMRDCRAGKFIEIYFIHIITGQFLF